MTGRYMDNSEQDSAAVAAAEVLTNGGSAAVGTFVAAAVAHVMVDFMGMSVWPVYKTLAGLDVAKVGGTYWGHPITLLYNFLNFLDSRL